MPEQPPAFFQTFLESLNTTQDLSALTHQFQRYKSFLSDYNKKINLISEGDLQIIWQRHFLDALAPLKFYPELLQSNVKLIDIGSGAGFPGFPLKILCPNIDLTTVDSVQKKCIFLQELQKDLNVSRVTILAERCEVLAKENKHREQYDWTITRAAAHFSTALEYVAPLIKIGGYALFWLGTNAQAALDDLKRNQNNPTFLQLGLKFTDVNEYKLPNHPTTSTYLRLNKIKTTHNRIPRLPGMAKKKPLF